jgi:hypothetical protein
MKYNKKYFEKIANDPLPSLTEDERIYLNVTFKARSFARISSCGFDSNKKLWFTGIHNSNLKSLIKLYGVNEATSEKARQLLKENDFI